MTQEEKLKEAKRLYQTANADQKYVLESLFPELVESEDERIRRGVIEYLQCCVDDMAKSDCPFDFKTEIEKLSKYIDWLEKQSDTIKIKKGKNYLCTKTHKYAGVEWIEGVKYYSPEDYSLVNQECKYYCPKYSKEEHNNFFKEVEYDGCLEKQGEQKVSYTTLVETGNGEINALVTRESPTNSCDDANYCSDCINKKGCINCENGDMKETAHKVEPKFEIEKGKWYVCNTSRYTDFIVGKAYYCPKNGMLKPNENEIARYVARDCFHPWTIADAKDGDVLAANECYVIFKEIDGLNIRCYCTYHYMGFNPSFHIDTLQNKTAFKPATKEQRNALMKAMADAGYTFDFEKKELKKVEDKNCDGEDYGIDSLFHAQRILEKTLGKVDGYQSDDGILSHKCAISAVKKLYEQKPAEWSEEDEEMLDNAVYACLNIYGKDSDTVNWLKSLKPRNMWKPSDEQIKAIRLARSFVMDDFGEHPTLSEILMELEEQLQKIKENKL